MKILVPTAYAVLFSVTLRLSRRLEWDLLAALFLLLCVVSALDMLFKTSYEGRARLFEATTQFYRVINASDNPQDNLRTLGFFVPWIDVSLEGLELQHKIGGTQIPLEFFKRYIRGSNAKQVWPLRSLKKKAEIALWHEVSAYLARWGKIKLNAAGNHSHLWATDTTHSEMRQVFIPTNAINMTDWE